MVGSAAPAAMAAAPRPATSSGGTAFSIPSRVFVIRVFPVCRHVRRRTPCPPLFLTNPRRVGFVSRFPHKQARTPCLKNRKTQEEKYFGNFRVKPGIVCSLVSENNVQKPTGRRLRLWRGTARNIHYPRQTHKKFGRLEIPCWLLDIQTLEKPDGVCEITRAKGSRIIVINACSGVGVRDRQ